MMLRIGVRAWQSNPWISTRIGLEGHVLAVLTNVLALLAAAGVAPAGENWARFRGPNGTGVSKLKGVPVQWTEEDYAWVVELPGKGHSSPVIWGDSLFVASGDDEGKRMLICLDALTGERRWRQTLTLLPEPAGGLHVKNSHGSGTPTTDGERVYVSFADDNQYQVAAFEASDGSPVWSADLGPFVSQHGHGQSPIVYGDLLIATNDQMGPSSVVALDRKTGNEVWRSPRPERRTCYSTPMILELNGRTQLICLSGAVGFAGLDPHTGEQLWSSGTFPLRTVASPVYGGGVFIGSCGKAGRGTDMFAVEPPQSPDSRQTRIRWSRTTNLPYVPTPIISDDILYLWVDGGFVCSVDLQTGSNLQRIRVGGGTYSSSPVLIDGKLYCPSEDGQIAVVAITPELKLLGMSPLGDRTHATPAVGAGGVYFRGFHTLACLRAQSVE